LGVTSVIVFAADTAGLPDHDVLQSCDRVPHAHQKQPRSIQFPHAASLRLRRRTSGTLNAS